MYSIGDKRQKFEKNKKKWVPHSVSSQKTIDYPHIKWRAKVFQPLSPRVFAFNQVRLNTKLPNAKLTADLITRCELFSLLSYLNSFFQDTRQNLPTFLRLFVEMPESSDEFFLAVFVFCKFLFRERIKQELILFSFV